MPFWNFFRDIFGGRNLEEPKTHGIFDYRNDDERDSFRNPIWQNDEDDDDMDDYRHSRRNMQFHIFSDPIEITKYFESQMDSMLKSFMFGFNNKGFDTFMNPQPFISPQERNLRNGMLKSNNDVNGTEQKLDTDLDGKITTDNFSTIWDKSNQLSKPSKPQQHIIGKSIVKEYIRRADGTIEQKQVFRDNEGNEEVTVSQQNGDKIYTVVTKKDKNGVETKTENFVNMDESELTGKKWLPSISDNDSQNINLKHFPWEKFFKPDPKL